MKYDYAFYEIMDESSVYMDGFIDMYNIEHQMFTSVMEAGNDASPKVDLKVGKGKGHFITKIVQAFHRILQLFMTNSKKLRKKYRKWVVEASKHIDSVDFSKLQVNVDPAYIEGEKTLHAISSTPAIKRLTDKGMYTEANRKRFFRSRTGADMTNMETFLRTDIFKELMGPSGSLGEGSKSYFRYGDASITKQKPKTYTGEPLRQVVRKCADYCIGYDKLTDDLNRVKNLCANTIKAVADRNEALSESYIYLEESFIKDTELTLLYPMLEAEANSDEKSSKPEVETGGNSSNNNTTSNTQQNKQQDRDTASMKSNVASSSKDELKFIKFSAQALQTILTSALTVAEERYVTYIKILRYALKDKYKFESIKNDDGSEETKIPKK